MILFYVMLLCWPYPLRHDPILEYLLYLPDFPAPANIFIIIFLFRLKLHTFEKRQLPMLQYLKNDITLFQCFVVLSRAQDNGTMTFSVIHTPLRYYYPTPRRIL